MKVDIYKCDQCGDTVTRYRDYPGWLHFTEMELHIAEGKPNLVRSKGLDFCTVDCLNDWLQERLPDVEDN